MSSQIGNRMKVSIFGESHGVGIGAVIDGFPAGVKIDMEQLLAFMKRRAPGRDKTATTRKESDLPQILSGVMDDVTCGTPIAAVIQNTNQRSKDYKNVTTAARPGRARCWMELILHPMERAHREKSMHGAKTAGTLTISGLKTPGAAMRKRPIPAAERERRSFWSQMTAACILCRRREAMQRGH